MSSPPPAVERGTWLFAPKTAKAGLVALFGAYCAFVFGPIVARLASGRYFGWDLGQYFLTSRETLTGVSHVYRYPFPMLPALYLPLVGGTQDLVAVYAVADLLSGFLMVGLFLAAGLLGYALTRSVLAAGASAVSVGTFSLLLGEIGLGEQAQLLAFALAALALGVLVRGQPLRPGLSAPTAAGMLLLAATFAEAYSTAYFVLVALLYVALTEGRGLRDVRALLRYWAVPVLPLVALGAIVATGGYVSAGVAALPILPRALTLGGWERAVSEVGLGSPVALDGYILAVGSLVVFALFGTRMSRRAGSYVVATIVACVVQVFLLTPEVYWDRAEFFLVFPFCAAVAAMAPGLPRGIRALLARDATTAPRTVPAGRRRRWVDTTCALVVVGVLVAQSAVAYELFPAALRYYSVDPAALSQLTWLRGEPGAALVVAPSGQPLSIANAIGRPVFPLSQPVWFDSGTQRQRAIEATLLTEGRSWIAAGSLSVVDTASPSNATSPAIFDYRFPYFVKLFDLGESEGPLPAALEPHPSAARAGSPSALPAAGTFSETDLLANYTVLKATGVAPNGTVVVNLTFNATTPAHPTVYLALGIPQAHLVGSTSIGSTASVQESFGYGGNTVVRFSSSATVSASSTANVSAPVERAVAGVPTLFWPIAPSAGPVGSEFNVTLSVSVARTMVEAPRLVSETAEIAASGIAWVVIDTPAEPAAVARFAADPAFSLYWSGASFEVFRVV